MKGYGGIELREKTTRLKLLIRLLEAGLMEYVTQIGEHMCLLAVAKDLDPVSGTIATSGLIWDCR